MGGPRNRRTKVIPNVVIEILLKHHGRREEDTSPSDEYLQILNARDGVLKHFQPIFSDPANLNSEDVRSFLDFKQNPHGPDCNVRPHTSATTCRGFVRHCLTCLMNHYRSSSGSTHLRGEANCQCEA